MVLARIPTCSHMPLACGTDGFLPSRSPSDTIYHSPPRKADASALRPSHAALARCESSAVDGFSSPGGHHGFDAQLSADHTRDQIDEGIAAAIGSHIAAAARDGAVCASDFQPRPAGASCATPRVYTEAQGRKMLRLVRASAGIDDAVPILALALVERCVLETPDRRLLTDGNWHAVFLAAISLAHKVSADEMLPGHTACMLLADALSVSNLGALETRMACRIAFRLNIPPRLFFDYYFALRDLGARRLRSYGASDELAAEAWAAAKDVGVVAPTPATAEMLRSDSETSDNERAPRTTRLSSRRPSTELSETDSMFADSEWC